MAALFDPTYSRDGFHAQDKRILRQVSRVRQRVLLPQLPEQRLQPSDGPEVVRVIACRLALAHRSACKKTVLIEAVPSKKR